MSKAVAHADVVSLDEYRRHRGARRAETSTLRHTTATPLTPVAAPVWVYWVPVWIW